MQNKTLQALLDAAAAAHPEDTTDLHNLGQELAEKLRGGQAQAQVDEFGNALNISCPIHNNTGCPV